MDKKDSLYDFSEAYDIAFSYRNYEHEVNFLLSFMKNKPHTSLEIAGGPARHSLSLAKKGLNVDALDNSSKIIEYSKKLFHSNNLEISYFNQDMVLFDLEKKYDLIINMIDSISHVSNLMDLKSHFLSVEKHLNTGGLYIIEAAHFKSLSDSKSTTVDEWTTENGNKKVFFKWTNLVTPNPSEQIYNSLVSIQVEFNGELFKIEDKFKMRLNTLEDFKNSMSLNLNLKDTYGNFDKAGLNDPKAWRMILVFEKV